ncbi:hypothetical protein PUR71_03820 [Streptomyces sp. SP17BM10]|uniref:tetratricopeptide repeat protein n=1 Tax=Streptomyces sp. SP17BM10 TaxID=3002530 RepID=UPI002E79D05E|nr:hypothetical protein [Streptomyces sp. SP17BM10]MEE1782063.1 hypothetical protein [Streptomyces sp. SP17BM10]
MAQLAVVLIVVALAAVAGALVVRHRRALDPQAVAKALAGAAERLAAGKAQQARRRYAKLAGRLAGATGALAEQRGLALLGQAEATVAAGDPQAALALHHEAFPLLADPARQLPRWSLQRLAEERMAAPAGPLAPLLAFLRATAGGAEAGTEAQAAARALDWLQRLCHDGPPEQRDTATTEALAALPGRDWPVLARAAVLRGTERAEEAESLLAAAAPGGGGELWFRWGAQLFALRRDAPAVAAFDEALRRAPGEAYRWSRGPALRAESLLFRGLARQRLGETDAAWADFQAAAGEASWDPRPRYALGRLALLLGADDQAQEQFGAALAAQPAFAPARFGLALVHERAARAAEAAADYRAGLDLAPDWRPARVRLGAALLAAGRTAEAEPLLRAETGDDSRWGRIAGFHHGLACFRSGDPTGALTAFERLRDDDLRTWLAVVRDRLARKSLATDPAEARELWQRAAADDPHAPGYRPALREAALREAAHLLVTGRDRPEARTRAAEALALADGLPGTVGARQGRLRAALALAGGSTEGLPGLLDAHAGPRDRYHLAAAALLAGRPVQTVALLAPLEPDPAGDPAVARLRAALAERAGNWATALEWHRHFLAAPAPRVAAPAAGAGAVPVPRAASGAVPVVPSVGCAVCGRPASGVCGGCGRETCGVHSERAGAAEAPRCTGCAGPDAPPASGAARGAVPAAGAARGAVTGPVVPGPVPGAPPHPYVTGPVGAGGPAQDASPNPYTTGPVPAPASASASAPAPMPASGPAPVAAPPADTVCAFCTTAPATGSCGGCGREACGAHLHRPADAASPRCVRCAGPALRAVLDCARRAGVPEQAEPVLAAWADAFGDGAPAAPVRLDLALLRAELGRLDEALAELPETAARERAAVLVRRAAGRLDAGEPGAAAGDLREVLRLSPGHSQAAATLGMLAEHEAHRHALEGRRREAWQAYHALLLADPTDARLLHAAGLAGYRLATAPGAEGGAEGGTADPQVWRWTIGCLAAALHLPALWAESARITGRPAEPARVAAARAALVDRLRVDLRALDEAEGRTGEDVASWTLRLAMESYCADAFVRADLTLRQPGRATAGRLVHGPTLAGLLRSAPELPWWGDQFDRAVQGWQRASRPEPHPLDRALDLFGPLGPQHFLLIQGRQSAAVEALDAVPEAQRDDAWRGLLVTTLVDEARGHRRNQNWREALDCLTRAHAVPGAALPADASGIAAESGLRAARALLKSSDDDQQGAAELLERALVLAPDHADVRSDLGATYAQWARKINNETKDYPRALTLLRKSLALNPGDQTAKQFLSAALGNRASQLTQPDAPARDLEEAVEQWRELIDLSPDPDHRLGLAFALRRLALLAALAGRSAVAVSRMAEALRADPEFTGRPETEASRRVAVMLANHMLDTLQDAPFAERAAMLRKAMEYDGEGADVRKLAVSVWRSEAVEQYEARRYPEAVRLLEEALRLSASAQDTAKLHTELGIVLSAHAVARANARAYREARQLIKQAVEHSPQDAELRALQRKINSLY